MDGEKNGYEEDRKQQLKQQNGCERQPLQRQQIEQWFEPKLVEPQQLDQGRQQPKQPPLRFTKRR